uniref:DUF5056 domain-containing protein n=1 Tax=Syphacia muris TaxID=451379 RepID=A0A0N5AZ63_9BILA
MEKAETQFDQLSSGWERVSEELSDSQLMTVRQSLCFLIADVRWWWWGLVIVVALKALSSGCAAAAGSVARIQQNQRLPVTERYVTVLLGASDDIQVA